ncbi:MAG: substrate-binding domain-containing protein [Thermoguttaceae bacterium]|nr:substrate-binding domain-containing protein [Thermoguttaceae bacterium]
MSQRLLARPFRVLILLQSAYKTHRDALRGAARYARLNGAWSCGIFEGREDESWQNDVDPNLFDGAIIAESARYADLPGRLAIPTIFIDPWKARAEQFGDWSRKNFFSFVWCDNAEIAKRGAEYLFRRGYRHYAFINAERAELWSEERERHFCDWLRERGWKCSVYRTDLQKPGSHYDNLSLWLRELPKPIGVMAATDAVGRLAVDAARELGIKIPNELGIIGVDNDELLCESTNPFLSSVENNIAQTIFQAADRLDQQMKGQVENGEIFYYRPKRIVERGSTRGISTEDELVLRALEIVKLNIDKPFGVEELAQKLDVSRRTLELRFRSSLGRAVSELIRAERLEKARAMLLETNYSVSEIARKCGFRNQNYLATSFRRHFNVTPAQFRKKRNETGDVL